MNVIWEFSQGTALPRGHAGVCMQLVAYYSKAGRDQSVGADEAVTWQLRKLRLRSGVYTPCASGTAVVDFMDEKRQGYSMGIYFSDGGGHALGFWRSGQSTGLFSRLSGHTYFFDPNAGCYKGDTSEFKGWLRTFMNARYPTCNKMEMAKVDKAQEVRKHWQGAGAFRY